MPLVPVVVYALYSLFTNWIVFCYILFLFLHIAFMLGKPVRVVLLFPLLSLFLMHLKRMR